MKKIVHVVKKSLKEQVRSYWVLLLTFCMGPFFIFIYFLITETSEPSYRIGIVNEDSPFVLDGRGLNYGVMLLKYIDIAKSDSASSAFVVSNETDQISGSERLKNRKLDALVIIKNSFSEGIIKQKINDSSRVPGIEFSGDLTSTSYLVSALWAGEVINNFILQETDRKRLVEVKETPLGISAKITYFDMIVPGILIISLIMLMFTASMAFVSEAENKTMMRLKMSKLTAMEFVGGVGIVQLMVGVISMLLTFFTAISLGFQFTGSLLIAIFVAALTSLSIIAFGLIIAAITRSANEVLIVGNFPMFLFMFFTGAAFPLETSPLLQVAGYPVGIQGLMTPTHAISALNKTLVMDMDIKAIIPEITAILVLTIVYFFIGAWVFKRRHMKLA